MFDAHCHLDDPAFDTDLALVIQRAQRAGVERFVSACAASERWSAQHHIASTYPCVSIAYGLHPWEVAALLQSSQDAHTLLQDKLDALAQRLADATPPLPVAIGECGLDRSRAVPPESEDLQRDALRAQLALARDTNLPIILHVVRQHGTMLAILRKDGLPPCGGMVHSFSGSMDVAEAYIKLGLSLSFGAMVTKPNAKKARAAASQIPSDLLLCETDAPFMPLAHGPTRNEPAQLTHIIQAIASLRHSDPTEIASHTTHNAKRLFALQD